MSAALYPLVALPESVASSVDVPSEKTLSDVFEVGFCPREAYTPVAYTDAVVVSGNAICVVLTDDPLTNTSSKAARHARAPLDGCPAQSASWNSPQSVFDLKISDPREFALVVRYQCVTQCHCMGGNEQIICADGPAGSL